METPRKRLEETDFDIMSPTNLRDLTIIGKIMSPIMTIIKMFFLKIMSVIPLI
jgi:hypothetical protein